MKVLIFFISSLRTVKKDRRMQHQTRMQHSNSPGREPAETVTMIETVRGRIMTASITLTIGTAGTMTTGVAIHSTTTGGVVVMEEITVAAITITVAVTMITIAVTMITIAVIMIAEITVAVLMTTEIAAVKATSTVIGIGSIKAVGVTTENTLVVVICAIATGVPYPIVGVPRLLIKIMSIVV